MPLKQFVRVYGAHLRRGFVAAAQFRADTLISALSLIVQQTAAFIGIWAITRAAGHIGGWSFYDIGVLYTFFLMLTALNNALLDGVWNIGNVYIRRGRFDILLTRPAPVFFQLIAHRLEFSAFLLLIVGFFMQLYFLGKLGVAISIGLVGLILLFVLCGSVITTAIYLIFNSLNFWIVQGNDVADLSQTLQEFSKYPISVFPKAVQFVFVFIMPYAFTTYYPAAVLTGRVSSGFIALAPLTALIVCLLAGLVWRAGLRRYDSTGS